MGKILLFATAAIFVFYSCKKDTAPKSFNDLQTLPTSTVTANGIVNEPVGVDLTGFQLLDLRSNEIWTTLSGTVVFLIASDRNVKPLGVYNFVFQDKKAVVYRGGYSLVIEPFNGFGQSKDIFKLTFTSQNISINRKLLALMEINVKEDGTYTLLIDSGTIEFR